MLVEPVSGADRYPLRTAADALAVIDRVQAAYDVPNLGLLADLYHLAVNGDDVDRVIAEHTDRVAHVQIADAPGRNEPGTGTLPLDQQLSALAAQRVRRLGRARVQAVHQHRRKLRVAPVTSVAADSGD